MSAIPPQGLSAIRFRVKHLARLVGAFALLLAVLVPVLRIYGAVGLVNASLVILLISPWLLGMLVLLVGREGPVKYWAAPLLLSVTAPALAVWHDSYLLDLWLRSGIVPNVLSSLLLNIALVGSFTFFLVSMSPSVCPQCGHRSLIPLLQFRGRPERTAQTRWCGACGQKSWRSEEGEWHIERRATWIDATAETREESMSRGE